MQEFIRKHYDHIHGVLSCFDRMLFRGYLPIMSGWAMAQFLNGLDVKGSSLKRFLLESSERVKDHAIAMAQKHARPFQYLVSNIRKEDTARQLAERDGIEEGLVCVFSILEPCRTFSFCFQKGGPFVRSARRKCLHLYFYFMDRDFGLLHVRIQTWFPMQIEVYPMRTSGSHGSPRPMRYAIPSTTTSFSGSRIWPKRRGSPIALQA
jgi:hypothetical protein